MPPTYADIVAICAAHARPDRPSRMPFLGLLTGLALALVMWSGAGWLVLRLLD